MQKNTERNRQQVAEPGCRVDTHAEIRGDFTQLAGPRSMSPYRAGQLYLHGGASLQEAVVPVIELRLDTAMDEAPPAITVRLNYKEGAKRITTRLPVLKIAVDGGSLFSGSSAVEVLIEAHDKLGNVVGEPKPGGGLNPATGTISLRPGALTTYDRIDLETDYTV
jgi:hypothetical protein